MKEAQKLRVVIADDEEHIRELFDMVMMKMNCLVVGEARNGQEAVDLFEQQQPDLLLLDLNMPIKSGDEALEEIMHMFPQAFVIILSSVADVESVERCVRLGASNYLRKDTPLKDMIRIIKESWMAFQKERATSHVEQKI